MILRKMQYPSIQKEQAAQVTHTHSQVKNKLHIPSNNNGNINLEKKLGSGTIYLATDLQDVLEARYQQLTCSQGKFHTNAYQKSKFRIKIQNSN